MLLRVFHARFISKVIELFYIECPIHTTPATLDGYKSKPLLGSREAIMPRPSLLDLDVRLSPHPAPDVLSRNFCSCGDNRGSFRVRLEGSLVSSFYGSHLHDVGVPFRHLAFLIHRVHKYGFAFSGLVR